MEIKEGYVSFRGFKTYYRIANPDGKRTPLLILHGGPGSTHNSYEVLDDLASLDDRPIITYDQIGCGLSSLDDPHPNLWVKETWVDELINLRSKLNLTKIHLMGHSWGGMLAIIYYADKKPFGIKSLVLSSTLSSVKLWREETHRLVEFLSEADQKAIKDAEETNDFDSLEFNLAMQHYMRKFVGGPWTDKDPSCLIREKKTGHESYLASWGPSEFSPNGTLKDYEYTDTLKNIKCPVLLTSGANDESTPVQNKLMFDMIQSEKKWVLFQHSRHMSYVEEHEKYIEELRKFLDQWDGE